MKRPRFEVLIAVDRKPYWVLIAANGRTLCMSETFESTAMAKKGIRAARRAAILARTETP